MNVRIYQPSRATTQSATGKSRDWVLEYEPATPRKPDTLMGWTSSGDALNQIRLRFPTQEDAIAYADREGLSYSVQLPAIRKAKPRSYTDRFRPVRSA